MAFHGAVEAAARLRRRRLDARRGLDAGAPDWLAGRAHAHWDQRPDARRLHAGHARQPFLHMRVEIEAARFVESGHAAVDFGDHRVVGAIAEVDERGPERHPQKETRRRSAG